MNNVECESCVKRKTMYCPNSFKCYATKDKPYWQNRIMLLEENNQLKEQIDDCSREIDFWNKRYNQEFDKLKELRSWLEEQVKDCDNYSKFIKKKLQELKSRSSGKTYIANEIMKNEVAKKCFKECLSKLNELENKSAENGKNVQ